MGLQIRAVPWGPCCPLALDNWNGDLHLHGWHVCSTGQGCLWVLLSAVWEKKKGLEKMKEKWIYSSKHSGSKKMQEIDAFGQSAGLEMQTWVCTPSLLTPLTLICRISSEEYLVPSSVWWSASAIWPNLSGKASNSMLQPLDRLYVYTCLLFQSKDPIKRVSYARDILNGVARYCCRLSYSVYQASWCWRLVFGNVMFTKMVSHWTLCNKCFT